MANLTVIAPFWRRHENLPRIIAALDAQTLADFQVHFLVEDEEDQKAIEAAIKLGAAGGTDWSAFIEVYPTPKDEAGKYTVIPYAYAINHALETDTTDYFTYLDNGSLPLPEKYETMVDVLDRFPRIGSVYCGQRYTGFVSGERHAKDVMKDAYGKVNFTQVMHRAGWSRWPLELALAKPDLADATFWRALHKEYGDFYPVAEGRILDEHHIPGPEAANL